MGFPPKKGKLENESPCFPIQLRPRIVKQNQTRKNKTSSGYGIPSVGILALSSGAYALFGSRSELSACVYILPFFLADVSSSLHRLTPVRKKKKIGKCTHSSTPLYPKSNWKMKIKLLCVSSFSGVSLSLSVFYLAAKLLERSISKLNHENDKKA